MATSIKISQRREGKLGSYIVSAKVGKDIWTATCDQMNTPQFQRLNFVRRHNYHTSRFIVKTAPGPRLEHERDVLKQFRHCPQIRQLVDEIIDPPSLILQFLDEDLLRAPKLERAEIKVVAKRVLQAIKAVHQAGYSQADK